MPEKPLSSFSKLHEAMYICTEAACGSKVSGIIKRLEEPWIFLDADLPHVDDRKVDDLSMDLDIKYPSCEENEILLN